MALQLVEIGEFEQTASVAGAGEEFIVVRKADGKTYKMSTADFKAFLGTVQIQVPKALAPTDTAPTLDGIYEPTVNGVYANAGGLERLSTDGYVRFIKNGATWVKVNTPIPQAENKIKNWTAKAYTAGEQVIDNGLWYEAVVNTTSAQRPSTSPSTIWKLVPVSVNGKSVFSLDNDIAINSKALVDFLNARNPERFLGGEDGVTSLELGTPILMASNNPNDPADVVRYVPGAISIYNDEVSNIYYRRARNLSLPNWTPAKVEWSGKRRNVDAPTGNEAALLYTDTNGVSHVLIPFLQSTTQFPNTLVEKISVEIPADVATISACSISGSGEGNSYVKVTDIRFKSGEYIENFTNYIKESAEGITDPSDSRFSKHLNPSDRHFLGGDTVLDEKESIFPVIITDETKFQNGTIEKSTNTLNPTVSSYFKSQLNIDVSSMYLSKVVWRGRRYSSSVTGLTTPLLAVGADGEITVLLEYLQSTDPAQNTVIEEIEVDIPKGTLFISAGTLIYNEGVFSVKATEVYKSEPTENKAAWQNFIESIAGSADGTREITAAETMHLSKPQLLRLDVEGILPTDTSDNRAPTTVTMEVSENNSLIFRCNAELAVQGRSSASHPKKGFSLDMYNKAGDDFEVKWGDWYLNSGFHLKAFWGDELMTRDVSASRVWGQIMNYREFPISWGAQFTVPSDTQSSKYLYQAEAKFYTDGIPCEIYLNGEWLGLYIWRMKKARDNYRTVKADPKNIHLESFDGNTFLNVWNPAQWELRTPDLSGYTPGEAVPSTYVNGAMERFTSWVEGCRTGSIDFNATYADYINLDNWVDYLIFSEMFYSIDGLINNYQLISWDGLIFYIFPYDLDFILGYRSTVAPNIDYKTRVINVFDNHVLNLVNQHQMPKVKARYAELRRAKVADATNIYNVFKEIPAIYGEKKLKDNFSKWSSLQYDKFSHKSSLQWLMQSYMNRLSYLDGVFEYTP